MARVLALSLALHLVAGVALARLHAPAVRRRAPLELAIVSTAARDAPSTAASSTRQPMTPPAAELSTRQSKTPRAAVLSSRASKPPRAAELATRQSKTPRSAELSTRESITPPALEPPSSRPEPPSSRPEPPSSRPEPPSSRSESSTHESTTPHEQSSAPSHAPNLFAPSALAKAADIDVAPSAADRAWRPRRGVGGDSASGGVDVSSFLAEDAARLRAQKGAVAPELRVAERRLDEIFAPTFTQADNSNKAQLFWKQFRGFLRDPPKTGALARALDPSKETLEEKMRSRRPDQAFFLGRRVEVFVRQKADGSILEMALRSASGYRAFDDAALAAVEKALAGRVPGARDAQAAAARDGEVRTLWQLDATAYVVISPEPQLVFDEATGKHEWVYPLQKRVDHHVRLVAVY